MDYIPIFCLSAHIAVMSHIFIHMYSSHKSEQYSQYIKSMNASQLKKYKNITEERTMIYSCSAAIGVFIAVMFIYIMKPKHTGCALIGLTSIISQFLYLIVPKKDTMLNHLHGQQKQYWYNVYRGYQFRTLLGQASGTTLFILSRFM